MTDRDYDPQQMREEILDEVYKLYRYIRIKYRPDPVPQEVEDISERLFDLVTKACGITDDVTGGDHG